MRFVFLVCFLILACSVVDSRARIMRIPSKCLRGHLPHLYHRRCRGEYKRFFFDIKVMNCTETYGCWKPKNGFSNKPECEKKCKVGIAG
uniref:Putative secreted protein n=1 Tax=Ixodes ricinus TaxID=34613 RepID=A0A090X9E8_IXORI